MLFEVVFGTIYHLSFFIWQEQKNEKTYLVGSYHKKNHFPQRTPTEKPNAY